MHTLVGLRADTEGLCIQWWVCVQIQLRIWALKLVPAVLLQPPGPARSCHVNDQVRLAWQRGVCSSADPLPASTVPQPVPVPAAPPALTCTTPGFPTQQQGNESKADFGYQSATAHDREFGWIAMFCNCSIEHTNETM